MTQHRPEAVLGVLALLSLALSVTSGSLAHADDTAGDELKVGIVILSAVNLNDDQADEMSARLGTALEKKHLIVAQAGAMVRAALGASVPETCVQKTRCVIELGRKLNVDRILFLSLVKVGRQVQLKVTPADTATGRGNARIRLRVRDQTEQDRVFADAVIRLLPTAKLRPTDSAPPDGTGDGSDGGTGGGNGDGTGSVSGTSVPFSDNPGRSRRLTTPTLVAGGVGVAALLSGVGFGISATRLHGQLEQECADGVCQDEVDRTRFRINVADVSFAVAVAAGVTATLLYLNSGESAPTAVTPVVTPDAVGVSWQGRF